MKKLISPFLCFAVVLASSSMARAASSKQDLQQRVDAAKVVLDQILGTSDRTIPLNILQMATCVGVVPGMKKGAFLFGVQYGQGIVTCRTGHGSRRFSRAV